MMEARHISSSAKKIGSILLENGSITREQLKKAVEMQKSAAANSSKKPLGKVLIELGYTTEEKVTKALAAAAGVEYVSLEKCSLDTTAATLIEPDSARRYRSLPIGFKNDQLVVAMSNPNDILAIDDIRLITGYELRPVCVAESELKAAIDNYSRTSNIMEDEAESRVDEPSLETEEVKVVDAGKPAVKLANMIFIQAVRDGASDIHIEPQERTLRIRFRIDGVLHEVMNPPYRLYPPPGIEA